jgi:hypothetical protein
MKKISLVLWLCVVWSTLWAQTTRPIGVNLSYVTDYSTELVFTNAFRQCRPWISSNADNTGPWDTQVNIPLRPDGYPIQIPYNNGVAPSQKVKTLLLWDLFSATPTGVFRLKTSGTGQIRLSNGASGIYNSPCDVLVPVNDAIILEILSSDFNDPVHDIRFILPEYINNYQEQVFTDELLSFLADFGVIRFMDFTQTNGSPIVSWSDRTPSNYYTQAKYGGAAWEYVVQLANTLHKDIWINIPHKANDAYVDSLASFIQAGLNPALKIYLEYSNEVWNGGFSQHAECAQMAQNIGFSGQPWERAWKYTAKRSADVFDAFEQVFSDNSRLVKIIPSQAANSWLTNQLVTFFNDPAYNPGQVTADAIAIAPYFGHTVADNIVANNQVNTITTPQIIEALRDDLAEAGNWITQNAAVADNHHLTLVAYEGGQHLVGTGSNINNAVLTQKLIAANRDSAMQALYCDYLDLWYQNTTTLFCHYASIQRYSPYGSWGLMESFWDTLNPKYVALQNCVFNYNFVSGLEDKPSSANFLVYPNPTSDMVFVSGSQEENPPFALFNTFGQLLYSGFGTTIDLKNYPPGLYLLKINFQIFKVIRH